MSELHVKHIKGFLSKIFVGKIDLTDVTKASTEQQEVTFLTRSLAALAIMQLADVDEDKAAKCVVDGPDDNGIDAIYFDRSEKILIVVQSKWHSDGHGSIEKGEAQKFITGFRDLINTRFDRFNSHVTTMKADIEAAVYDAQTRMQLVLVYSGQDKINPVVYRDFDDLLTEMNDPVDTVAFKVLSQAEVHGVITKGTRGTPINLEVALSEWGQIKDPYYAIYGHVELKEVASWWNNNYPRIVAPNLRMFLGGTDVNSGITDTIRSTPEHFWYFNNGVTVLCSSISKKPIGGNSREMGYFECNDVSIVNGAQTVGSIATAAATYPDKVEKGKVLVRFISLKDTSAQFASNITQFTNTQNRIERRDFVALDPEQQRLRTELLIDNIDYIFKAGDAVAAGRIGFDLTEAAAALACGNVDIALAVQAKREIGKLWEDINKPPYKVLFNPSLNGPRLWHLVQIMKIIDSQLADEQQTRHERNLLFAVHGNRIIAWLVMQEFKDIQPIVPANIKKATVSALDKITHKADELNSNSYLAILFKNLKKCKEIIKAIK